MQPIRSTWEGELSPMQNCANAAGRAGRIGKFQDQVVSTFFGLVEPIIFQFL